MDNIKDFTSYLKLIYPDINGYDEALYHALDSVPRYVNGNEALYFGEIGHGCFFSDGDFDHCRWLPDTNAIEALGILRLDLGERIVEDLEECLR